MESKKPPTLFDLIRPCLAKTVGDPDFKEAAAQETDVNASNPMLH